MRKILNSLLLVSLFVMISAPAYSARLKDISTISGVRDNMLVGYGLVVGLDGSGDKGGAGFTLQSVASMLERQGVAVSKDALTLKNVAAVMVTAKLPPFARNGSNVDVLVSTIGDAKSLQGGVLIMTPLLGPDGNTYVVAQGPLSVGGFSTGSEGSGVQKNHPTVGRIPDGGIVEREIDFNLNEKRGFTLILREADFTTASRVVTVVNSTIGSRVAFARDAGTVDVFFADDVNKGMVELIASIELLEVYPDVPAKIVLDERTGTVVIGENIRISTVAVSHGNLSITVKETPLVSQPAPFAEGETVVVVDREVTVEEKESKLLVVESGTNLGDIVAGLNAIGVSPRDLIAILQAIKAAGALHAELEII